MNLKIKKKALIKTNRLNIKPYCENDIDRLVYLLTDKQITKYFMVPTYDRVDEYKNLARKLISFSSIDDTKHLEYGIYLNDLLIGFINDCNYEDEKIEIGYVIDPIYQGKGYAQEAVKAIICELKQMGFKKVCGAYFEGNDASRRVMERCGMHLTGETDIEEYRGKKYISHYLEIDV